MPQLHFYVSGAVADRLRHHADQQGLSLSRYLALLAVKEAGGGWPEGYFESVIGKWRGDLERPRQGKAERRDEANGTD